GAARPARMSGPKRAPEGDLRAPPTGPFARPAPDDRRRARQDRRAVTVWLQAEDGPRSGRRFPLDAPCLVGRGPYNHVVLDDTRISRQHAKISPEPTGHYVYDLNSANGTFVNDLPVERQKLAANDVIRFGPFRFRFLSEGMTNPTIPIPMP